MPGGGQHAPYYVKKRDGKWVVVNKDGEVKGTHDSREEALDQQRALYVNVPGAKEQAEKDHKSSLYREAARIHSDCQRLADQATESGDRDAAQRYRRAQSLLASAKAALDFVAQKQPVQATEFPAEAHITQKSQRRGAKCPRCASFWPADSFCCSGCNADFGDLPPRVRRAMRDAAQAR